MEIELPDYVATEKALGKAGLELAAAELHGVCSGMLVVNPASPVQVWLDEVLDADPHDFYVQEVRRLLQNLFVATQAQLQDAGMGFALWLPEDDDLAARLEAVQQWCQGFTYGVALAGLRDSKKLPADSREWLSDVGKIGASGEFDLSDAEASEAALAEIEEYLRVGVLLMQEELHPQKTARTLH